MDSDALGPCAHLAAGLAVAAALPEPARSQLGDRVGAALTAWSTPASGRPEPLLVQVRRGWPPSTLGGLGGGGEPRGTSSEVIRQVQGANPAQSAQATALPDRLPPTCVLGNSRIKGVDLLAWLELTTASALVTAQISVPRGLLIAAARTGAKLLAAAHPGRSIELRVPGAIAVQLGDGTGPRHTRGTPPNVIETDPATLLELLDGSIGFAAAKAEHRVAASGVHADLAPLLPL